jgi:hypothetical protein
MADYNRARSRIASPYNQRGIVARLRGHLADAEGWYITEGLGNQSGID